MSFLQFYTEQLSKNKSLGDIAKIHSISLKSLKKEFKKGSKIEKEHTKSLKKAKKIAMDHLVEDPKYYTKLSKAGL